MKRASFFLLVLLSLACGSSPTVAVHPPAASIVQPAGSLEVGVARVDITPPPGVSTFGHGPDAHVTNGYWTRLYCRVFVLQTAPGNRVALVPCDLPAIGALLHREVTDLLAEKAQGKDGARGCKDADEPRPVVAPWRVMLSATHTHAGPAHYLESFAYGGVTSTRLPGFDEQMVSFLATRIAKGIREAACSLHPAEARWTYGKAWQLTRNRSLLAFAANGPPPDFGAPPHVDDLMPEELAVDPRLDVLHLRAVDARGAEAGPLGSLVFFAMHPTVLPNTNRLLGGDTHGVASRILEEEMRRAGAARSASCMKGGGSSAGCAAPIVDPLAGIFNTNEGDVSPRWIVGNLDEAVRLARGLAARALDKPERETPWQRQVVLDAHALQVRLPHAWLFNGSKDPEAHLCPTPELGNAAGHGAADHPTSIDSILPAEGDIDPERRDCQRPKRELLGSLQRALLGREATRFPTDVMFGMVRIGGTWLSFVPAELTVHAGELVNQRVKTIAGLAAETRVVGLSNSYIQYVTTEAEYALQRYEGGSTLYGPKSAQFVAERAELLARAVLGQRLAGVDEIRPLQYERGPERSRLALVSDETAAKALGHERRAGGLCRLPDATSIALCFWWTDVGPATALAAVAPWLALVDATGSEVHTCANWRPSLDPSDCDPTATIDDRGIDFRTSIRGRAGNAYRWGTILRPSHVEWATLKTPTRIRVAGTGGAPAIHSGPFSLGQLPNDCTYDEAANCVVE